MEIFSLAIDDVLLIKPTKFEDNRGWFSETYHFEKFGKDIYFKQDNHVYSKKNVIRGLHFQNPHKQGKLVRCIKGKILDVAVDIRPKSPTFGMYVSEILSGENMNQLWIPGGFAHGYSVLSDESEVLYKCDEVYHPEDEGGIIWDDTTLNIDWKIDNPIVSEKDIKLPKFREITFES